MKKNKIQRGVMPPLFERIIQHKAEKSFERVLLDEKGLKESIIRELGLILNTRSTVRKVYYEEHLEEIPIFGMPDFFGLEDFSDFDASNRQQWPKIALLVATTIRAAEPRLQNIHVIVDKYDAATQSLSVSVTASLVHAKLLKDIHFPLTFQQSSKGAKENAA